jgi:hypothetical protein
LLESHWHEDDLDRRQSLIPAQPMQREERACFKFLLVVSLGQGRFGRAHVADNISIKVPSHNRSHQKSVSVDPHIQMYRVCKTKHSEKTPRTPKTPCFIYKSAKTQRKQSPLKHSHNSPTAHKRPSRPQHPSSPSYS